MDLILIAGSILITLLAQIYVSVMYNRYKIEETNKGKSGFEVAREILDANGMSDVYVVETPGNLTDHYDPRRKTVKLSTENFNGTTISSNAIAAHEAGHAIQHKVGYGPIKLRNFFFPIANFGSKLGYIVIFISLLTGALNLLWIGIGLILLVLIFQLITLPVEFDASRRAKNELSTHGFISNAEMKGTASVLNAAALTYVASVLTAVMEIARLILIARRRD